VLRALAAQGLAAYDPQLGRLLSVEEDEAAVRARFAELRWGPRRRPWWQFW
jgi:hypothetical protein